MRLIPTLAFAAALFASPAYAIAPPQSACVDNAQVEKDMDGLRETGARVITDNDLDHVHKFVALANKMDGFTVDVDDIVKVILVIAPKPAGDHASIVFMGKAQTCLSVNGTSEQAVTFITKALGEGI